MHVSFTSHDWEPSAGRFALNWDCLKSADEHRVRPKSSHPSRLEGCALCGSNLQNGYFWYFLSLYNFLVFTLLLLGGYEKNDHNPKPEVSYFCMEHMHLWIISAGHHPGQRLAISTMDCFLPLKKMLQVEKLVLILELKHFILKLSQRKLSISWIVY